MKETPLTEGGKLNLNQLVIGNEGFTTEQPTSPVAWTNLLSSNERSVMNRLPNSEPTYLETPT